MVALQIVFAGIFATAVMTFFMNLCAVSTRTNMFTVAILSQMLPGFFGWPANVNTRRYRILALIVHYGIGVLFSALYYLLSHSHGYIAKTKNSEALLIGILLGLVAVGGWSIFLRMHPEPLSTVPWPGYLLCIFIGHIIFAAVMLFSYHTFFTM